MYGGRTYTVKDSAGTAIASVTVSVFKAGTDTLSTIYSSGAGAALTNPDTSDGSGISEFYAAAGFYDVRFFKTGYREKWLRGVQVVSDTLTAEDVELSESGSTTAGDMIKSAMRKLRVYKPGEAIDDAEVIDNLEVLNTMLEAWSADGLMIPASKTEAFTLTAGQSLYTIGPGGDFNTTRPIDVDVRSSYVRDSDGNDTLLSPMTEREYNSVYDKSPSSNSEPAYLWYDPQYPLGRLQFDDPVDGGTLYLVSQKPLDEFPDITTEMVLQPGYKQAIIYNLAVMLAPEYGVAVPAEVGVVARESRSSIEHRNAKPIRTDFSTVPTSGGATMTKSRFESGDF